MTADKPNAPRPENQAVSSAALLLAEIERLKTELIQAEWKIAELEERADVDPLLDILNRRGFERELARSIAYVKRYDTAAALVFLDLDGFKAVNDLHGHAAGDALLKAVAQQLTGHVRASDVVARLGGDEFAVLMWNVAEAPAAAKARELEAAVMQARVEHRGALSVGRRQRRRGAADRVVDSGRRQRGRRQGDVCAQERAARLSRSPLTL
ncbi:MAG: GGDEF domain-containing protein [Pseudolabrys sp.]